jgi:hypothetical protein
MNGFPIFPGPSDVPGLSEIAGFLGNTELLALTDRAEIGLKNVCDRLRKGHASGRSLDDEVNFAASHFDELDHGDVKELDISLTDLILDSPALHLNDEDSLLEFICLVGHPGPLLLRHIQTGYLSTDATCRFLDLVSAFAVDTVIWSSLCGRLQLRVLKDPFDDFGTSWSRFGLAKAPPGALEFPMTEERSLEGIISYLTEKHGGNVHDSGIVTITANAQHDGDDFPKNVADFEEDSAFFTRQVRRPWLCWDFHEMRVRPTHYTVWGVILTPSIEGSIDGENWRKIDLEPHEVDFKHEGGESFAVSNPTECRFVRLNWSRDDDYHGGVFSVEFFGTLYE